MANVAEFFRNKSFERLVVQVEVECHLEIHPVWRTNIGWQELERRPAVWPEALKHPSLLAAAFDPRSVKVPTIAIVVSCPHFIVEGAQFKNVSEKRRQNLPLVWYVRMLKNHLPLLVGCVAPPPEPLRQLLLRDLPRHEGSERVSNPQRSIVVPLLFLSDVPVLQPSVKLAAEGGHWLRCRVRCGANSVARFSSNARLFGICDFLGRFDFGSCDCWSRSSSGCFDWG